jgi:hypothetical protein
MADEFEFLSPVRHTFIGSGEDVSQLECRITVRNRDALHSRLLVEPSKADAMGTTQVAEGRTATRVKDLLGRRVVLVYEEFNTPLENCLPEVEAKKTLSSKTEGICHDLCLRCGEGPRCLPLRKEAETCASMRPSDTEPDSRG